MQAGGRRFDPVRLHRLGLGWVAALDGFGGTGRVLWIGRLRAAALLLGRRCAWRPVCLFFVDCESGSGALCACEGVSVGFWPDCSGGVVVVWGLCWEVRVWLAMGV